MIIFHYSILELLDNSQLQSMYKANTLLESSLNVADDTVISDEDQVICKKFLKTASSNVAQVLSGYMKKLVDDVNDPLLGFEFDIGYSEIQGSFEELTTGAIVFRLNMPDTFNTSLIPTIDDLIQTALENFVLMKMAKLRGIDSASYQESYDESLSLLRSYIHQRTSPISTPIKFY